MEKELTHKERLLKEIKSYEKEIMKFDRNDAEINFCPAHYPPKEDGLYITIRCGFRGIHTYLNEWKGDKWQMEMADGSTTIAYSRNKVELKAL